MNRLFYPVLFLAFALALGFRAPELGLRPMHNDEAVNAIKLRDLMEKGEYRYDPDEYHGPTLIYSTRAFLKIIGSNNFVRLTEFQLRWVSLLYGLGLILLLPSLQSVLGRNGVLIAGLFTALSPAMVFYSRYYIHEMLLVFFSLAGLVAGFRYYKKPTLADALILGLSTGLMQATKETFVLPLAAASGAFLILRWIPTTPGTQRASVSVPPTHLAAAFASWFAIILILFSSFFENPAGILDAIKTYLPWLHRVQGASLHLHPWTFYFERLLWFHQGKGAVWSEGLIFLLAIFGMAASFSNRSFKSGDKTLLRFLSLYTLLLTLIYTVLSYKTPWCLLGFWQPMILLAGFGAVVIFELVKNRMVQCAIAVLIFTGSIHLGYQAWRGSFEENSIPGNPYIYAQTSQDIIGMALRVQALSKVSPETTNLVVKIYSPNSEYWPLPWYLRGFPLCGWYDQAPTQADAPVMIVSTKLTSPLDSATTHVLVGIFQLRPNTFFKLYVEQQLFDAYVRSGLARELPD